MKKTITLILMLCCIMLPVAAQEYVMVGKTTNLYSEPSTSTPMLNQWDDTIELLPGMAFEMKGESGDYYIIDIPGWKGAYLPKSACATPEAFEFTPGTYQFKYESDSFPVTFTRTADGTYDITGYRLDDLKAKEVPGNIIVITWDGEPYGSVTTLGGTMRVWLYDTTVLPWN
ncbi:MAG: hypothetical protein NC039_04325 [Muribaculaceae bacterium]|nr:hypothetical protein [Muribaculaceae bacterium]